MGSTVAGIQFPWKHGYSFYDTTSMVVTTRLQYFVYFTSADFVNGVTIHLWAWLLVGVVITNVATDLKPKGGTKSPSHFKFLAGKSLIWRGGNS